MAVNLAERPKGQIAITRSTALALEGAFGIYPDRPESPAPISEFNELWVNVRTIYRNLVTSFAVADQRALMPDDIVAGMWEDMHGIVEYVKRATQGRCEVIFYRPSYDGLARVFPNADLKVPDNANQLAAKRLEDASYAAFDRSGFDYPVNVYDVFITGYHYRALMLTHISLDLLATYHFKTLCLLESNTGLIKRSTQWSSKLGVKEASDFLPFNTFTLQVFGDRNTLFRSAHIKLRRAVLELANERRWNSVTTADRIRSNLKTLKDPEVADALSKFATTISV